MPERRAVRAGRLFVAQPSAAAPLDCVRRAPRLRAGPLGCVRSPLGCVRSPPRLRPQRPFFFGFFSKKKNGRKYENLAQKKRDLT